MSLLRRSLWTAVVAFVAAAAFAQPDPHLLFEHVRPYLGVPYLWGGTDPNKGLDCSAFVRLVYGELGLELPRTSRQQYAAFPHVTDRLLPGDLLYFSEDGRAGSLT